MTEPPLVDAALAATRRGWPVFPAHPGGKRPAVPDWEHQACTDPERITRWWTRHPHANPAIATGPAGLLVLDLDDATGHGHPSAGHGGHTLALIAHTAGEQLPWTFTVRTPNNGLHRYYAQPDGVCLHNTQGRIGPLIDTRGHGGYVLATGARLDAGRYETVIDAPVAPLPQWLTDILTPPEPTNTPVTLRDGDIGPYVRSALLDEARRVRTALPGTRRACLLKAAARMGRLPGLDDARITETLRAASDRHVAEGAYSEREREQAISDGIRWGREHPRRIAPIRP